MAKKTAPHWRQLLVLTDTIEALEDGMGAMFSTTPALREVLTEYLDEYDKNPDNEAKLRNIKVKIAEALLYTFDLPATSKTYGPEAIADESKK